MFSQTVDEGTDKALDIKILGIFIVSFWLVVTANIIMQRSYALP